jgi:DNA-binding MarR family transcriptional regulator
MARITKKSRITKDTYVLTKDLETGEMYEEASTKEITYETDIDEFYMVFLSMANTGLSSTEMELLSELCTRAEYELGYCDLSSSVRASICEKLKMTNNHMSVVLNRLTKKGFIFRKKSEVHINPDYFWRGTLKARKQRREENFKIGIKFEIQK